MSSALQNRLVGTIIVVAIAVIFLPDLLDGKQESKRDLFVELPHKPSMKSVKPPSSFDTSKVKEAATRKIEVISDKAIDDNSITQSSIDTALESRTKDVKVADIFEVPQESSVSETSKTAADKSNSLGVQTVIEQDVDKLLENAGWVVQLGSFRHQKNVKEVLNKLDKAGYRAFSRPVKTNSGTLTKIFVGPDLKKENLDKALSHLKEITNLHGRVTPFTVQ